MAGIIVIFFINDTKLSSHMAQISEHINSSNHKIHSHDQMGKIIFNLRNKKCEKNNNSTGHLNHIQKSLLMSIIDTPENDVSNFASKVYKRKIRTSLINSSSTLFSCSIWSMYNRFNRDQNQRLMLRSFIPEINISIPPNKYYEHIFSEKLINELYAWIENQPHVIHPPNVKDSVFVKINGTLVRKQNHIPQIPVRELHNDMILPSSEGGFSGARTVDGHIFIGDMSLRKCMQKYIKPMSNINNITRGYETCISAMSL